MCKQKINKLILVMMLVFGIATVAYAQEKVSDTTKEVVTPKTNLTVAYPLQEQVLPKVPPVPASISDTKGITKYVAAVNAYMDAAQKYIDAATDDLNMIVEQRNLAIQNANKIIEEYNAFFEKHKAK
mgnify:CR=1 FL=1